MLLYFGQSAEISGGAAFLLRNSGLKSIIKAGSGERSQVRKDGCGMKIIEFFGLRVKPRITKGKHMFKPLETGALWEGCFAIRDKDGNCFLLRTDRGYLAIDAGYKRSANVRMGLETLGIDPCQVHTVFLTHLDIDHAGGMDVEAGEIFPGAEIYLSREENEYLKGTIFRKEIGSIHCRMPIRLREDRKLLEDREKVRCGGIIVEAVYAPGHSAGHTAYRIGENLFVGDCLISDGEAGWCFYDFWNWDTEKNRETLAMLEGYCRDQGIRRVITSHSGILPPDRAFVHREESPQWRKKGFQGIPGAMEDPYGEP